MTGIWLLTPFFLIRFGLLAALDRGRGAMKRAAYFAPLEGGERAAYWVYQLSNLGIFVALFFVKIQTTPPALFWAGSAVSAHWIILAEERWCVRQFGEAYLTHMRRVRRYL